MQNKDLQTCQILITDDEFQNDLTNKTFHTRSWDDLACKSSNTVYGVECSLFCIGVGRGGGAGGARPPPII